MVHLSGAGRPRTCGHTHLHALELVALQLSVHQGTLPHQHPASDAHLPEVELIIASLTGHLNALKQVLNVKNMGWLHQMHGYDTHLCVAPRCA